MAYNIYNDPKKLVKLSELQSVIYAGVSVGINQNYIPIKRNFDLTTMYGYAHSYGYPYYIYDLSGATSENKRYVRNEEMGTTFNFNKYSYRDGYQRLYFKPGNAQGLGAFTPFGLRASSTVTDYFNPCGATPYNTYTNSRMQYTMNTNLKPDTNNPYRFQPYFVRDVNGYLLDILGGYNRRIKGVIVFPQVVMAQYTTQSGTTNYTWGATGDPNAPSLAKKEYIISNIASQSINGISTDTYDNIFSNPSNYFSYVYNANNYTRSINSADILGIRHSITMTKTNYYYEPFIIYNNYNWFFGSLYFQILNYLSTPKSQRPTTYDFFGTVSFLRDCQSYINKINGVTFDSNFRFVNVYENYIGLDSSSYYLKEGTIFLSLQHYNHILNLMCHNIHCTGGTGTGQFNDIANTIYNGINYQSYSMENGTKFMNNTTVLNNINSKLDIGLSTAYNKNITVITFTCLAPAPAVLETLHISECYSNYIWWVGKNSSNQDAQEYFTSNLPIPISNPYVIPIDLFSVIIFDDECEEHVDTGGAGALMPNRPKQFHHIMQGPEDQNEPTTWFWPRSNATASPQALPHLKVFDSTDEGTMTGGSGSMSYLYNGPTLTYNYLTTYYPDARSYYGIPPEGEP